MSGPLLLYLSDARSQQLSRKEIFAPFCMFASDWPPIVVNLHGVASMCSNGFVLGLVSESKSSNILSSSREEYIPGILFAPTHCAAVFSYVQGSPRIEALSH
jgi:hypothetical protein